MRLSVKLGATGSDAERRERPSSHCCPTGKRSGALAGSRNVDRPGERLQLFASQAGVERGSGDIESPEVR